MNNNTSFVITNIFHLENDRTIIAVKNLKNIDLQKHKWSIFVNDKVHQNISIGGEIILTKKKKHLDERAIEIKEKLKKIDVNSNKVELRMEAQR